MRRLLNWFITVMFIGMIAAPSVANLLGADGADPEAENRKLAAFPVLEANWSGIRSFLPGLDAWFSDHFAFRSQLVTWYGISRYVWLGVSPSPAVAIGPPCPKAPVFFMPFASSSSLVPSGTFHAISPVLALTAIRWAHGGG